MTEDEDLLIGEPDVIDPEESVVAAPRLRKERDSARAWSRRWKRGMLDQRVSCLILEGEVEKLRAVVAKAEALIKTDDDFRSEAARKHAGMSWSFDQARNEAREALRSAIAALREGEENGQL